MSFLYDPALLVGAGAVGGAVLDDDLEDVSTAATMALFWGVSVPLWLDSPRLTWFARFWGAKSGRDFMLNSGRIGFGLLHFDPARRNWRRHVVAVLIFLTYPLWFRLGWALGRQLRSGPTDAAAAARDGGDGAGRENDGREGKVQSGVESLTSTVTN